MSQDTIIKRRQEALVILSFWKRQLEEDSAKVVKAEMWCFSNNNLHHAERNNIINKLIDLKMNTAELSYWVDFCNFINQVQICRIVYQGEVYLLSSTLDESEEYMLPVEYAVKYGSKILPKPFVTTPLAEAPL